MKLNHTIAGWRRKCARAYTLIEVIMALGLGGLIFGLLITTFKYSLTSFSAMGNYGDLDRNSRATLDLLSREIRNSSALTGYSATNPKSLTFTNSTTHKQIVVTYDSTARTLTLAKTGQATKTLLTSCDQWDYSLFGKVPLISSTNISFNAATNGAGSVDVNSCKLINMTWKCSRTIFGSKRNTESIQTAQIVLRNKVN